MPADFFGVCSMCRKQIPFGAKVVRCSVTACNSGRMKLLFCSTACWDAHIPTARHRNASYLEETATRAAQG
jgi:LSD1 subclass zinc finger protein